MAIPLILQVPDGNSLILHIDSFQNLQQQVEEQTQIPIDLQRYHIGGRHLNDISQLVDYSQVTLFLPLLGGKGGFGSLLKNQAQTRRKIVNWDQSRDRDGRRIINTKNEQSLIEFFKTKLDDEKNIAEQNKVPIKQTQEAVKLDQKYKNTIEENEKKIQNSIQRAKKQKQQKIQEKKQKMISKELLESLDQFIEEQEQKVENQNKEERNDKEIEAS